MLGGYLEVVWKVFGESLIRMSERCPVGFGRVLQDVIGLIFDQIFLTTYYGQAHMAGEIQTYTG